MNYKGMQFNPGPKTGHDELINIAITRNGYKSYLEIGCAKDHCFNVVQCALKVGVDPVMGGTLRMTSDEFFAQNTNTFDVIFIDGYHHHEQVFKDIENSLKVVSSNGLIVMHDCHPPTLEHEGQNACGTAWRAFAHFRQFPQYDMIVGNFDMGVGLMRFAGTQQQTITLPRPFDELTYDEMTQHTNDWLRLTSPENVLTWLETV